MNDEWMKLIEQTAMQATDDAERIEKEACINWIANNIRANMSSYILQSPHICSPSVQAQLETWSIQNHQRIALQMEQIVRLILHKELFE